MTSSPILVPRPGADEYGSFYHNYVQSVPSENLFHEFEESLTRTRNFIESIPSEKLEYRYAPGKWTIKDLLVHLIDAERIFAYRALRFARRDSTDLPGFDENIYVPAARASERPIEDILREWYSVRLATIELFRSFSEEDLMQKGTANKYAVSVRALGYIILGHESHHLRVIKERYL